MLASNGAHSAIAVTVSPPRDGVGESHYTKSSERPDRGQYQAVVKVCSQDARTR